MKRVLMTLALILTTFMVQGCKKDMDYKPQDFFEGKQLEIAQLIYDGNEAGLKQKLSTVSKEDLNRPAKAEMTLLFWAVLNSTHDRDSDKRLQVITDLVKSGADPLQPRTEGGSSPAEFVLQGESGIWIKAMLDGGLSPNARDIVFNKPIIFKTIWAKNTETLKVMLEYGADINIKDRLKQTVLVAAFYSSSFEHVKLLLNSGAEPNPVDINNFSLLNVVKRKIKDTKEGSDYNNKCKEILALMLEKGAK